MSGRVAAALTAKASELFAQPPQIEEVNVLAAELPRWDRSTRDLPQEVVVDYGLVTSRKPDDIPAFNAEVIKLFVSARQQTRQGAAQ